MPDDFDLPAVIERASACRIEVDGALVDPGAVIARLWADLTATELRVQQLQVLLARSLVFDRGSAEDAAEALGGLPEVFWLVEQYHLTTAGHVLVGEPS